MHSRQFYGEWLRRTFRPPLVSGQAISFLLALAGGIATRVRPELAGQMNFLLWAVPLAVFILAVMVGFILAPYQMHQEVVRERDGLQIRLVDLERRQSAELPVMHVSLSQFRERIAPRLEAAGYEIKFPAVEKRLAFFQDGWEEVVEEVAGRKHRIVVGDGERVHNLAFVRRRQ